MRIRPEFTFGILTQMIPLPQVKEKLRGLRQFSRDLEMCLLRSRNGFLIYGRTKIQGRLRTLRPSNRRCVRADSNRPRNDHRQQKGNASHGRCRSREGLRETTLERNYANE